MALAFTVIKRSGGGPFSRGMRRIFVEITGETSYVSTGTAIAASDVGLKGAILAIYINAFPTPSVDRYYIWSRATGKLQAIVRSTGAEVAGAVNVGADKIMVEIVGY